MRRPPIEVICYTAGLFDNKRRIGLYPDKHDVSLRRTEGQAGFDFLLKLQRDWDGIGTVYWMPPPKHGDEPRTAAWQISSAGQLEQFLSAIRPHLRAQRTIADEILARSRRHMKTKRYFWTQAQDQAIITGWETKSLGELSLEVDRSRQSITYRARKLGLPNKHRIKRQ